MSSTATRITIGVATLTAAAAVAVAGVAASAPPGAGPAGAEVAATSAESLAQSRTNVEGAESARLVDSWLELWNGDETLAEGLISPDFTVHAAIIGGGDGSAIRGPEGLLGFVRSTRAIAPDLQFTAEVGPIAQDDMVVVRWTAEGTYAGGLPTAAAPVGTPLSFTGTDVLRIEDGQIAEYWLNSDTLQLLTQLQVLPS